MKPWIRLFAVLAALVAAPALAQLNLGASSGDLLEPEKAFQFSAHALGADAVEVSFKIADGYYMYRDKFRFALDGAKGAKLGAPEFPAGIRKKDEFFGEIETYRRAVDIRIPVERDSPQATTLLLKVTSQGCADLGVCYTPMDSTATIRLAALGAGPSAGPPALSEGPRPVAPDAALLAVRKRPRYRRSVRGQPLAGDSELLRLRAASDLHALRAADGSDHLGHRRGRGQGFEQAARPRAVDLVRARAWR